MAEEIPPPRALNPFAFPSETELRFLVLVWLILSLCWNAGYFFSAALAGSLGWPKVDHSLDLDVLGIQGDYSDLGMIARKEALLYKQLARLSEPQVRERTLSALVRLGQAAEHQWIATLPYLGLPFAFLFLVGLFIAFLYFLRSRRPWLGRHSDPPLLLQRVVDGLIAEAQSLERELGGAPMIKPCLRISRGAVADGQVYGASKSPRIVLTRAVGVILKKDLRLYGEPVSVRALVLHELAHLANSDVARSCLAEVSWVISIPVLALWITTLWMSGGNLTVAVVSLQVLGLLLAVELIRRGLLRSREHFADLRAGLLWRTGEPLRGALRLEDEQRYTRSRSPLQVCRDLWRKHPGQSERQEVLNDPGRVFSIRRDAAFFAGFLFGSTLAASLLLMVQLSTAVDGWAAEVTTALTLHYIEEKNLEYGMLVHYRVGLWGHSLAVMASSVILPMMTIYLLAGTLGVQTQRESVLQIVDARRYPHPYRALWRPALLGALGFEVGLLLSPLGWATPESPAALFGILLWVGYATLLLWLWLATIRFFARRVLGRHVAARKPAKRLVGMNLASAILLLPLVGALMTAQFWLWPTLEFVGYGAVVTAGILGLLVFAFLLVWMLFLLAFWLAGRQVGRKPSCPSCGKGPCEKSVADFCAVCGESLAPWLFLSDRRGQQFGVRDRGGAPIPGDGQEVVCPEVAGTIVTTRFSGMKQLLRRTWEPILVGTVLHQGIHSMPIITSVVYRVGDPLSVEPLAGGCLYFVLLLVANFFTGFVHTFLLGRRSDVGMAVCFLDGGTIGVLSTLTSRLLVIVREGTILDLLLPPSDGADPVLWIWKIGISFIIMAIFCFMGLVSGGVGGGFGGLIARWAANLAARGSSPPA